MSEQMTQVAVAGMALAGLAIFLAAALRAWHGWLELKRLELTPSGGEPRPGSGSAGERIEMADLKERIRKLESLAAAIEL